VPHAVRRPVVSRLLPAALVCIALVAAGCGDDADTRSETAGMPTTLEDLQAERWVLDGEASTPSITDAEGAVTIAFDAEEVHGTGPCNVYGGAFEVDDDSISLGPLASTMRACEDPINRAETDYLAALEAVESSEIDDDDRLVLSGPDVTLVFDALDVDEALRGTWSIVNVASGDAIVSVVEGSEPTLTLSDDGEASVSTGCNNGATSWERDGDSISFGVIAGTLMACEEDLMVQQDAIFAALEASETFEVSPDQLTLLDADGNMLLVAAPE
jgi:heat shock protein HslJ